jgi:ABC-type lipoprotein release transport system permease subunit
MNAVYDDQAKGSDTSHQFVYLGITPEMQKLKPQWKIDGDWPRQANEILIGSIVATQQGWRRGQKVLLPGLEKQQAIVSGILAPTQGADDSFIHARLPDTQQWFKHPTELTHILVRLKDPNQMDTVVEQLRGCDAGLSMNVVPLTHLFHTIQTLVDSTRLWLGSITLIALLVAATGVSNALLMAVTERTSEIATMRALGAGKADIFRLFWLETIQLSACGGTLGVLLALLGARLTEQWLRVHLPFAPTGTLLQWQWSVAGWCVAAAVVFGSIAALLPAWRAARLEPALGMRIKS